MSLVITTFIAHKQEKKESYRFAFWPAIKPVSMKTEIDQNYFLVLDGIKDKIRRAQYKAVVAANNELLQLYWEIGMVIAQKEVEKGWGSKVVELLSADLRKEFPGKRGYSTRNLRYMRNFALAYPDFQILQQVAAKLPWFHLCTLLDRVKNAEEREFYIVKAVENGWSRNVLELQIEFQLHKRTGQAINNFKNVIPEPQSGLAIEAFKNPYVFDFLGIEEKMLERDLEKALLQNITKFLLELGSGFAFVSQQTAIDVDEEEFFPDLIFYHLKLRRYVVIDLKMKDFKPEYAGKMSFYLSVFDNQYKTENDEPSIGLLLCKGAKKIIAEYALQGINQPIGVSTFILKGQPLPSELKDALPPIKAIEEKIEREIEKQKNWVDEKIEKLKKTAVERGEEHIQISRSPAVISDIFDSNILPLFEEILPEIQKLNELFMKYRLSWSIGNTDTFDNLEAFRAFGSKLENFERLSHITFYAGFETYKAAGKNYFNLGEALEFTFNHFEFSFKWNDIIISKLYHQRLEKDEIHYVAHSFIKLFIEEIEKRLQ